MNFIKLFANDLVLFSLNMIILIIIYIHFINQYFILNLWLEILSIAICYYFISLITTSLIICLLYQKIKLVFTSLDELSILRKFEIISYVLDKYYDEINSIDDFELKLKNYL